DPTLLNDPDADPDQPDIADFSIEVEAHDVGGRTIAASRQLRVGAQALLVAADGERGFFLDDESPALRVRLVNLEARAVGGKISWELARLGPPRELPAADLPLERALNDYPGQPIASGQLEVTAGPPTPLRLARLAAGGYRLTLTAKDPWGQTVRGRFHFLVA